MRRLPVLEARHKAAGLVEAQAEVEARAAEVAAGVAGSAAGREGSAEEAPPTGGTA